MAVERTLAECDDGDAVLVFSDCQGAMRAIRAALDGESEYEAVHDARTAQRSRAGGTVLEAIVRHIRRIR